MIGAGGLRKDGQIMDFQGKRVLILDAYCRQTLPIVRGFKKIGCEVTVLCNSKLDVGYASKYPDHKILLSCSKDDHKEKYAVARKMIEQNQFDLVVPMNDYGAIFLAEEKEYLSRFTQIAVNDPQVFDLAINKLNTMRICMENGIPCPRTFFVEDINEILADAKIQYPLVVKPKTACGSIGFNIAENMGHLQRILSEQGDINGPVFVQEYIPQDGSQYGAEAFRNKDGTYSFILIDEKPRWFPLDGGSPTINVSIHDSMMVDMTKKLLDAMNWVGYANIDFVMDCRDHQPKIIEVNGRISAAVSIDEAVGINVSKLICENAFADKMTLYKDYKDGVKVSCFLTEILWFAKSKERFSNKPSMFNRKNTTDVIFSWKDLKPFLTFCIQSAGNYRHAMDQRKRS